MPLPLFTVKGVPLHEAIRQRRIALGLTQAELGRRIGTSSRNIQRLETTGPSMPSWIRLQQLALALKLPINAFRQKLPRKPESDR